jgi:sec-independent protein translocase protein TatA
LGGAVKGFKSAMKDGEDEQDHKRLADDDQPQNKQDAEQKAEQEKDKA